MVLTGSREKAAIKRFLVTILVEAQALASGAKSLAQHVGIRSPAGLADTIAVVIIPPAARLADETHDSLCPIREVSIEPFDE